MPNHTGAIPFFDATKLPDPDYAYVAWIDVLGVRAVMARSLPITANFIFKLHAAILDCPHQGLELYPVMDGAYVVSSSGHPLRVFLEAVLARLGDLFVSTPAIYHRFIAKAAIAYGPIVHGKNVPAAANLTLSNDSDYRDSILIGMPMVQAFQGEARAPAFGVFVDASARAFAPRQEKPFPHIWWSWWRQNWIPLAQELRTELEAYFDWCEARAAAIEYDRSRIEVHRDLASQYFADA